MNDENCDCEGFCGLDDEYDEYGDSELGQWFKKVNEEMHAAFASGDLDTMAQVYKNMIEASPYDEEVTDVLLFSAVEAIMMEIAMEIVYRASIEE